MTHPLDARRSRALGRLVARVHFAIGAELARETGVDERLSPAQKAFLIRMEAGGARAVDVARRLGISKQAASKLVAELEAQGLIRREPDPSDARATVLRYSEAGEQVIYDTLAVFERIEARLVTDMGDDGLAAFKDMLRQAARTLDPEGF